MIRRTLTLAALSLAATAAPAQELLYTFEGTVTSVLTGGAVGQWETVTVGDPFRITFRVDTQAVPTVSEATQQVWSSAIVSIEAEIAGIADSETSFSFQNVVLQDDWMPTGGACIDRVALTAFGSGASEIGIIGSQLYFEQTSPNCPVTSLTAPEFFLSLDPLDFLTTRQSGLMTTNDDVFDASITRVTVTSDYAELCHGDGGDQLGCTACPCANEAPVGTLGGCLNSSGNATRLFATGDPSVSLPAGSASDLRFLLVGGPPQATSVLLSGAAVAPTNMANPCFGLDSGSQAADRDGLRCAVQSVLRHGNRQTDAGGEVSESAGPSRVWGGEAQPNAGIAGASGFVSGQTRYFQVTHRDDPLQVCTRGLNTSQAVRVVFAP